jgi:hypothetical protein
VNFLGYLSGAVIHVDPVQEAGEEHHRIASHSHDGLPTPTPTKADRDPSTHPDEDTP